MTISRNGDEAIKHQVNSTNNEGYTLLHYACWRGHKLVAEELKMAGADLSARYGDCESNQDLSYSYVKNMALVCVDLCILAVDAE